MELMERMKRKRILGNKGFTLVEMVLTISIMAVLLGVVGINVSGYMEKAKYAKDLEVIRSFATAAVNYYSFHADEFSDAREQGGVIAFTVFNIKTFYTPAFNSFKTNEGKEGRNVYYEADFDGIYPKLSKDGDAATVNNNNRYTVDWSIGIMKLAGFYDSRDIPPENMKDNSGSYPNGWLAANSQNNFRNALSSSSTFGVSVDTNTGNVIEVTRISDVRLEYNFTTRTVTVRARVDSSELGTGSQADNVFEIIVPF